MRFSSSALLAAAAMSSSAVMLALALPHGRAEQCTTPTVRHEWRNLTSSQKADFIRATNCVSKLPHDPQLRRTFPVSLVDFPINNSSSLYDDFAFLHVDLNTKFHFTALFFPWHRYFIHMYETTMKEKCGFQGTIPYWDWRVDAADVVSSPVFDDDPVTGLGTFGDVNDDNNLKNGGFASFRVSYPEPNPLRRLYTLQPYISKPQSAIFPEPARLANSTFTYEKVAEALTCGAGDYSCLQTHVEGMQNMHGGGHSIVGGDFGGKCPNNLNATQCESGPGFTANDPIFWLHHSQLDRIWHTWQLQDPQNVMALAGGTIQDLTQYATYPMGLAPNGTLETMLPENGLFGTEWPVKAVMSITGGPLCYQYDQLA